MMDNPAQPPVAMAEQFVPGDIYEDCAYHPVFCVSVCEEGDEIEGISLIDGSYPRNCSLRHCGVRKLTVRALHVLRQRFRESVRIDDLAAIAGLSVSAFHRQFKTLTAMTPLQYQKQLRLLEARRLMVSHSIKVEAVSCRVGYESPSQVSREYGRMFGRPPKRDAMALQATLLEDRFGQAQDGDVPGMRVPF